MIFHISVPVQNPEHVARVMGELIGGPVVQFVPAEGAYMTFSSLQQGTSIEFVPENTLHTPGDTPDQAMNYAKARGETPVYTGAHVAIASPLSADEILKIADREGWRGVTCWRATAFPLVEVWIENRYMVEFFPPDMAEIFNKFQTPENFIRYFGMTEQDGVYKMGAQAPAAVGAAA